MQCHATSKRASATAPSAAPTKSFVYKVTAQTPLELIVHYPAAWKETDKRPAIVFFFGGGWTNGSVKAFEDSLNGIRAARAAGIFCVGIPNEVTRSLGLEEADVVVDPLADLPPADLLARFE